MGGTPVFGRLAVLVDAAVLSRVGWMPIPATLLSISLVLVGLLVWFWFLVRQDLTHSRAASVVLVLGLTEPFVGMAERFRFEPFCFMLMAVAFWMASSRKPHFALSIASLFLGMLAFEVEPAALIVCPALLLYQFRLRRIPPVRLIYSTLIAGCIFAGIYISLHPHILDILRQTDWHRGGGQRELGGFLRAYYITRKRHLPELGLLLLAAWAYLRRRRQAPPSINRMSEITALVCLFSFLMNWPTPAYMIFFYPFALVVVSWTLESWPAWLLPGVACLLILPQFVALAIINRHEGWRSEDIQQVTQAIRHSEEIAGLNDANTQIMGDYSLWFAHPDRYRALARPTSNFIAEEQLFLCFDTPLLPESMVDPIVRYCHDLSKVRVLREIGWIDLRGHRLFFLVPQ